MPKSKSTWKERYTYFSRYITYVPNHEYREQIKSNAWAWNTLVMTSLRCCDLIPFFLNVHWEILGKSNLSRQIKCHHTLNKNFARPTFEVQDTGGHPWHHQVDISWKPKKPQPIHALGTRKYHLQATRPRGSTGTSQGRMYSGTNRSYQWHFLLWNLSG